MHIKGYTTVFVEALNKYLSIFLGLFHHRQILLFFNSRRCIVREVRNDTLLTSTR